MTSDGGIATPLSLVMLPFDGGTGESVLILFLHTTKEITVLLDSLM